MKLRDLSFVDISKYLKYYFKGKTYNASYFFSIEQTAVSDKSEQKPTNEASPTVK